MMSLRINPLFIIEWDREWAMILRNLKSWKDYQCWTGADNFLIILSQFQGNWAKIELIPEEYLFSINYLIEIWALLDEKHFLGIENEIKSWNKYHWRDAMLYHYGSGKPHYIEPYVPDWDTARINEHESYLRESQIPEIYKSIISGKNISIKWKILPLAEADFMELLLSRKTVRNFSPQMIDLHTLYSIFFYATSSVRDIRKLLAWAKKSLDGICLLKQSEFTALEFYVSIYNCEWIAPGIYHFNLENTTFDLIEEGDFRNEVQSIQMWQNVLSNSAFSIYIVIDFYKQMWRYRYSHKYRALLIQIGKIAQDFITYALSYWIGAFMSPAIKDSEAEKLLHLNPIHEWVGYFMSFWQYDKTKESSYFFTNLPWKNEKRVQ